MRCPGLTGGISSLGELTDELETEEKYPERFPNSFWMVRGANRLMRRPDLLSCSNLFASSRPWSASMSSGDSAGGTSPFRGLGRSLIMERLLVLALLGGGSKEWERESMAPGCSGRRGIAREMGVGMEGSVQCEMVM